MSRAIVNVHIVYVRVPKTLRLNDFKIPKVTSYKTNFVYEIFQIKRTKLWTIVEKSGVRRSTDQQSFCFSHNTNNGDFE